MIISIYCNTSKTIHADCNDRRLGDIPNESKASGNDNANDIYDHFTVERGGWGGGSLPDDSDAIVQAHRELTDGVWLRHPDGL